MSGAVDLALTWRVLCEEVAAALGSDVDARRIVERASGLEGAELQLALDEEVPARAGPFVEEMVSRRAAGEPLQYVVGRWGFRSLDLLVDRRVLIPRPETEVLVEVALEEAARVGTVTTVVDLGTGSGAIALALAVELPRRQQGEIVVWATDTSAEALAVARANLAGTGGWAAPRVRLAQGSWFTALPDDLRGQVDLVAANPPYVAEGDPVPPELTWEPREALFAGPTGLEAIEEILTEAPSWLSPQGVAVVELAPTLAAPATAVARQRGFAAVEVRRDLVGRHRVLVARR